MSCMYVMLMMYVPKVCMHMHIYLFFVVLVKLHITGLEAFYNLYTLPRVFEANFLCETMFLPLDQKT